MMQSEVPTPVKMRKPKATINSLALELDFMIIEWLPLKDALNFAKALKLPEHVAVQYFALDWNAFEDIYHQNFYDIQPSSFKFLLKNNRFQVESTSSEKNWAALRTLDQDFVRKYIEQVKPDLNDALRQAAIWGFTDAVKLLISDYGVDLPAEDNYALFLAIEKRNLDVVKLLLSDYGVDPLARKNAALFYASQNGHLDIVKLFLSDDRVDLNSALIYASGNGHVEIVKILLSVDRVDPSARLNSPFF